MLNDTQSELIAEVQTLAQEARWTESDRRYELEKISGELEATRRHVASLEKIVQSSMSKSGNKLFELQTEIRNLTLEARWIDPDRKLQFEEIMRELRSSRKIEISVEKLSPMEEERIAANLSRATLVAADVTIEQRVLRSLYYPRQEDRYLKIENAYWKTFEWIFEEGIKGEGRHQDIRFVEWLQNQNGVYWISGKPGSGKSTLMKYLQCHMKTKEALSKWASTSGSAALITASFDFWNAGNDMQKSQEGLLRSLLLTIFKRCPSLISTICPSRWESAQSRYDDNEPWNISELSQAMKGVLEQRSLSAKYCFFIDGLDEYEGKHYEIIKALNFLTSSAHVKICLSSRPWNIFEDAYGRISNRKVYLQDLTQGDIKSYVEDNLIGHRIFEISSSSEREQCRALIQETVVKSQGVFLWWCWSCDLFTRG